LRLLQFDNEVAKQNARLIAYEVSKIFGDGSDTSGDTQIDRFGEAFAERW